MVVGSEQNQGGVLRSVVEVLDDRPRQRQSVKGGSAAAYFVEYDQGTWRGVMQDVGGLGHLHHECGLAASEHVRRSNAGEDPVSETDHSFGGRYEGSRVSHQRDQSALAKVGGLAAHVWTGEKDDLGRCRIEAGVVRNKWRVALQLFQNRVPPLDDGQSNLVRDGGSTIAPPSCAVGECREHVETGDGRGGRRDPLGVRP